MANGDGPGAVVQGRGEKIGRYEVLRRLAVGGMAEVFLAKAIGIEGFRKDVVIKRILPQYGKHKEMVEMFLDEARIAGRLRHPNIAQVFDIGEAEGEYFFAMEYVEGEDVAGLLRRCHANETLLPLEHAVGITIATATGLEHAHGLTNDQGESLELVHRDISPSNVMIGYDGTVKLVDFGIAKARERVHVTMVGSIKGKFCYMSPEQHRGDEVDRRSDIFALGIVLYEMATSQPLFNIGSPLKSREMIMSGNYDAPSSIRADFPRDLEAIIMRAIAFEPSDRYQEVGEMLLQLEAFARSERLPVSTSGLGAYMREQFGVDSSPARVKEDDAAARSLIVPGLSSRPERGTESSISSPVTEVAESSTEGWAAPPSSVTVVEVESSSSIVGTIVAKRYLVRELIGQSVVGDVYRAEQLPIERPVALTLLSSATGALARAGFFRRARAAARLHHHNITTLYDFGEDASWLFLATEYVEGTPLQELMSAAGPMPWQRAASLVAQIARGLSAAENEGVIHQDIKPANVVVRDTPGGEEVKILHFGLSRVGHDTSHETKRYQSPERARGQQGDIRSDLYSLGLVLFEMITGQHPLAGMAAGENAATQGTQWASPLADVVDGVPPDICRLVDQMLSESPHDRPEDASALVHALNAATREGALGTNYTAISSQNDGAPTERVTLVFAEVEGLANLWTRPPQHVRRALDLKRSALRETLLEAGGYELNVRGEGFGAAFPCELRAARWCLDAQRALLEVAWPEEIAGARRGVQAEDVQQRMPGLRLRMGAAVGRPECRRDAATGRMEYFGPLVAEAMAVASMAHGGQILVSAGMASALKDAVEAYGGLIEPSEQMLEGEVEALAEVVDMSRRRKTFPASRRHVGTLRSNLVLEPGDFVGRSQERVTVGERLVAGARIVTLLGPGGSGKTRLAKVIAQDMLSKEEEPREVWFCDFSTVTDEMTLASLVAGVLSVPLCHQKALGDGVELIGQSLRRRGRVLMVADNVEQVAVAAARILAIWLQTAPDLQLLVTSREALGLTGEERIELSSLNTQEGCELFAARVRELGLPPSEDTSAIARLVDALDGIPLAIELAAGRAGMLSPSQILARMGRRFDLLRGTRRDVSARQLTLRGAIDWSWDLLSAAEQDAFTQLAVFEGGVTLEEAESVVDLSAHDDLPFVLDVVQGLRDKSMLRAEPSSTHELHFSMLKSMQEYALAKLVQTADGGEALRRRHADYFVSEGKRYAKASRSKQQQQALQWLAGNRRNLLAVIENFREKAPSMAASAVLALDPLYAEREPTNVYRALLEEGVALARCSGKPDMLAEMLLHRAGLEQESGSAELALEFANEAHALSEQFPALVLRANALARMGRILHRLGRMEEGMAALNEAEPLARSLGASALVARILSQRGLIALSMTGEVTDLLSEAVTLARRSGDRILEARLLGNDGVVAMICGDLPKALQLMERALSIHVENESRGLEALIMGNLGVVCLALNQPEVSEDWLTKAIAIHRELGNSLLEGSDGANLACTFFYQSRFRESLELAKRSLAMLVAANAVREQFSCRCVLVSACASINDVESAKELVVDLNLPKKAFWHAQERLFILANTHLRLAEARVYGDADGSTLAEVRQVVEEMQANPENLFLSAITLGESLAAFPALPQDTSRSQQPTP